MGIAQKGVGGVKACQDGLEHFFPTFARGCKGLPGPGSQVILEHFFSTFARLTEEGGLGGLKHCPYRTNPFQNGAPLRWWVLYIQIDSIISPWNSSEGQLQRHAVHAKSHSYQVFCSDDQ